MVRYGSWGRIRACKRLVQGVRTFCPPGKPIMGKSISTGKTRVIQISQVLLDFCHFVQRQADRQSNLKPDPPIESPRSLFWIGFVMHFLVCPRYRHGCTYGVHLEYQSFLTRGMYLIHVVHWPSYLFCWRSPLHEWLCWGG